MFTLSGILITTSHLDDYFLSISHYWGIHLRLLCTLIFDLIFMMAFGVTQLGCEPTTYHMRGGNTNH